MVKIRATAKGRILGVDIDESLLAPSEKTMVEDLIAAAINDARAKADAAAAEEMQKMQSTPAAAARDSSCPSRVACERADLAVMMRNCSLRGGADGYARRNAGLAAADHAADGPCRTRAWKPRDRLPRAPTARQIRTNWNEIAT